MTNEEIQAIREQYKYDPSTLKTGMDSPVNDIDARLAKFRGQEVKETTNKTVAEKTGINGKVNAFAGGVAQGVGADLPLMAIDYLGKKAVNKFGTEQMKQNVANAQPLTQKFEDVTNQTENPIIAGIGTGVGMVAGLTTGTTEVRAIPVVAKQIEKGIINKGAKAVGQVSQGATDTKVPFVEALKAIETKGVKTYKDLATKIDEAIPSYSKIVDNELAKDSNVYKLSDLAVKAKSKGGQEVSTDYVTKAIKDLKELYKTTTDRVSETNLDELLTKAETQGLTRKEVNDISRVYNTEFGGKAFSKTGDPLTSVNAQAFENTRMGLKDVARAGLGGKEAQIADGVISSLFDAKKLVDKNVEAVNKLQQRIIERGWVSKGAYGAVKLVDTLTGGAIRGVTDAVLNRGSGLKTLNALDLEKSLSKNLDKIRKAMENSKTEAEFIKTLKNLSE